MPMLRLIQANRRHVTPRPRREADVVTDWPL